MPRRGFRSAAAPGSRRKPKKEKPVAHRLDTRGGARKGAGRKPGVPWREIERAANAGSPYEEIVAGVAIAASDLQNPAVQERIKVVVEQGNAKYKLRLRRAIKKRGIEEGSVNSLALMARNSLDWDQQMAQQGTQAPDLAGVGVRLVELVEKLAKRPPTEGACS